MTELKAQILENVAGGSKKSDQLNTTLTQVQSSIKDLAGQNNNGSSSTTMLMLALCMQNRQQPTCVAAPATTVVAQPAFSFRARFRF